MPSAACYLHLGCSWGRCHCKRQRRVGEHQYQTGAAGEGLGWSCWSNTLPQQEVFTAHDICTVRQDDKVTTKDSKSCLEKNGRIFQRWKSNPIHPTLHMKMFSSPMKSTNLKLQETQKRACYRNCSIQPHCWKSWLLPSHLPRRLITLSLPATKNASPVWVEKKQPGIALLV